MKAIVVLLALLGPAAASSDVSPRMVERARQDREIVYRLRAPETHSFEIEHDYTETREGADRYLNVVRQGSGVSEPRAWLLDTGEPLETEVRDAEGIKVSGLDLGEPVRPDSTVVIVHFPPVVRGGSSRLRIQEVYTDPGRYRLEGDELVWDRTLGRPRNTVILPAGWYLSACSIPATVGVTEEGRIRLDFVNDRPDEIAVLVKARRRASRR